MTDRATIWTAPNLLTIARIAITPVVALLPFIQGYWPKLACFVIFVAAAVTDVIDGRMARRRNQVTDLGKYLDPIADKLLLFATLGPIWWISRQRQELYDIPIWGSIPLWVCLLLVGREIAMTVLRAWAQTRGVVIAAEHAGKIKAVLQNVFIGGTLTWFAFRDAVHQEGWDHARFANYWHQFHGGFVAATLVIAVTLTIYSFVTYLVQYRRLFIS
ncbi:MAG TPA: CDP-diacylglycerol--glycerol-3-phosphate 3-phosphatidyltransferase [Gemmatimonadales bacterium]|jgi:CDP-diacylglycerol--glycerol-3-phosphate 3-phosphatidyltransferase|nr:CDP-diacylglycerol--glycerol-3-phosphate 3-phosphatidyltransferase [Gemmatimonadales bacterium]